MRILRLFTKHVGLVQALSGFALRVMLVMVKLGNIFLSCFLCRIVIACVQ